MRADLSIAALLCMAAATGCAPEQPRWEGYALRDRPGEDATRLIGSYGTLDGCRASLLASDSDASAEALVCTRGCPPPLRGLLEQCGSVQVVRPVQTDPRADMSVSPGGEPAAAADRSPGTDPSPP